MSSSLSFCEYVIGQIKIDCDITLRKMFGEYMIYLNGKPALLLCDNTVFCKKIPQLKQLLDGEATGFPYEGAKEHYVLETDEVERFNEVLEIIANLLR